MPSHRCRSRLAAWLLALVAAVLCAGCGGGGGAPPAPRAKDGVLDLRDWDMRRGGLVALDGQWQFHSGVFADPSAPAPAGQQLLQVPGAWNDATGADGRPMGANGFGTYRLTVLCDSAPDIALSLPMQHSAMRLYVNGRLVATQGTPGPDEKLARAAPVQQIAHLESPVCPLRLVAHVSNYDIRRGGLMRSIEAGTREQVHERRERNMIRDLLCMGGLAMMGLLTLLFYAARRKDDSPLYFGLLCLTYVLQLGMIGERVLQPFVVALGWNLYYKLIFMTFCATQALYTMFLYRQYPAVFPRYSLGAIVGVNVAVFACVLLTPAWLFSRVATPMIATAIVAVLVLFVVLGRAVRQRRRGAGLMLAGLALQAATVVHDIVNFDHLMRLALSPWGTLICLTAPAVLLARRFSRALSAEELRHVEQRERADLVVRATKAGVVDWDSVSGTIAYSPRYLEMLGYAPDTPASAMPPFYDMIHPDDRAAARALFERQLAERQYKDQVRAFEPDDYRLLRADGTPLWVHAEGIGVCGADGRVLRFICSFIDMTDIHEAEEALRHSAQRLDLVVRGARVGIVDWDGVTHDTYYSPHFRELRGYAPDADTSGWPDYFKVMIHPDDRERITKRWVKFILGKGPEGPFGEFYSPEEYRLLRADGSYAWVRVSGMAVRDDKGFVKRWIAAVIDVSERRAQEEALRASHDQIAAQAGQLERQNEALKENVRLREEVERIGRHDLKTPLNSIIAVPRLLREERELSADEDDLLGVVERAGYRILSMVNLSLDLYKIENGSYIFRPDAVDLADLAAKVMADLRSHAASKRVELRLVRPADGPGVAPGHAAAYAWAEELLCYSLIANLLKNAVEASPEGQVVTVTLSRDAARDSVAMAIHNMGAIPEAVRENFFQKYATAGKASGTGLGAYSARLMTRVQDGEIAMRTSDADGTTITVTLKAAPPGVVPVTARHVGERSRGAVPQLAQLPPLSVLLVDDDEYNLLIVRRFLPSPPLVVRSAINGRIALDMATADWPDVIFMDLDMPVMGGMETVRHLRALEGERGLRRCRIFALSSHDDPETQRAAIEAGFDQYLTKPVTRQAIHAALASFAGGLEAGEGARVDGGAEDARDVVIDPDMQPMIAGFVQSRLALLDALEQAIAAGNREELRRIAHQLAGSFGLYGFNWASGQARALERDFVAIDLRHAQSVADEVRGHLTQVAASVP